MEAKEKSILLIIPFFGKWPIWFDAHLKSIEFNSTINWLIPTDCEIPENHPSNIEFIQISFEEMNTIFNERLGFKVNLNYRKFCDLKPTYANVFQDYISNYDFWGFCDMDIIWGDIRKYMNQDVLEKYDIISSRKKAISGHFNIFRNTEKTKFLYRNIQDYENLLATSKLTRFDENLLTEILKENDRGLNTKWDEILCNQYKGIDSHQEYYINKVIWKNGSVYSLDKSNNLNEVMYLHFINWKRTMTRCDVIESDTDSFYISFNKIHLIKQPVWIEYLNSVKNLFNGYWIKENRRINKNKIKSLLKRVKRKLIKIITFSNEN